MVDALSMSEAPLVLGYALLFVLSFVLKEVVSGFLRAVGQDAWRWLKWSRAGRGRSPGRPGPPAAVAAETDGRELGRGES